MFDEGLDRNFEFADAVARSVKKIGSSLPDWMGAFENEGFCLGPAATNCLIEWERRRCGREGRGAFDLIDKLRALEDDAPGLMLDGKAVASLARGLGVEAKRGVLEGLREHRSEERWRVLESTSSYWFGIYKDLCRGQDRSGYLEACRARVGQDWTLALPVINELRRRKANEEACGVCAEAAASYLRLGDGGAWDPLDSLMAPRGNGPRDEKPDRRFLAVLEAWRQAAAALGRDATAEAIRLQSALLADWKVWDKALAAFRRLPPRLESLGEKLFDQWRSLVAERSLARFDLDWSSLVPGESPRSDQSWVRALADAARQGEEAAVGFREGLRLRLKKMEASRESLRRGLHEAGRLSLDLDGGRWLRALSPALARVLGRGWTTDKALLASRRKWLSRLGAAELIPELQAFWRRIIPRLVPDPASAGGDYEDCVEWLRALWEIDPDAARKLLARWRQAHRRRRSLWRLVGRNGLPVPEPSGRGT